MVKYKFIPHTDFVQVPWKNGLGVTQEIDKLNVDGKEGFVWRLSIAAVDKDGAFSHFEGYQRNISVLAGNGMTLDVDGKSSGVLRAFESYAFSGDADTSAVLVDGKISDFNLIYDPCFVNAKVDWCDVAEGVSSIVGAHTTVFILAGTDKTEIKIDDSIFNLGKWDVLRIKTEDCSSKLSIAAHNTAKVGIVTIQSLKP